MVTGALSRNVGKASAGGVVQPLPPTLEMAAQVGRYGLFLVQGTGPDVGEAARRERDGLFGLDVARSADRRDKGAGPDVGWLNYMPTVAWMFWPRLTPGKWEGNGSCFCHRLSGRPTQRQYCKSSARAEQLVRKGWRSGGVTIHLLPGRKDDRSAAGAKLAYHLADLLGICLWHRLLILAIRSGESLWELGVGQLEQIRQVFEVRLVGDLYDMAWWSAVFGG